MIFWLTVAEALAVLDNLIPVYGIKQLGGGVWRSVIGLFFALIEIVAG